MNPGKLRHRVTIQQATRTRGAGGGYTEKWGEVATVRAAVVPLTGTERIRAMQTEANLTHRIEMRYRAGLTSAMRAVYAGRTFEIRAVIDVEERRREIHLLAEEVA